MVYANAALSDHFSFLFKSRFLPLNCINIYFFSSPFKLNLQDIATVLIAWKHLFWMKNWNSAWHQSKTTFQRCWFFSQKERERQGSVNLIFTLGIYRPQNVKDYFNQKWTQVTFTLFQTRMTFFHHWKPKETPACFLTIAINDKPRCQVSKRMVWSSQ